MEKTNPKADVVQTGWAFVGFTGNDHSKAERQVPIGVYTDYCGGRAHANAWMKNTPKAIRWEGTKIYEENDDE